MAAAITPGDAIASLDVSRTRRASVDVVERERKGLFSRAGDDDNVVDDGGSCALNVLFASLNLVRYPVPVGMQVMRRFFGRFYFDLAILQWAMYDAIGMMPSETNRTTGGFQPEVRVPAGNPLHGRTGRTRSWRRLQMLWGLARFRRQLPRDIETIFRENRDAREMKLASLSDQELLAEFRRRVKIGNTFTPDIQLAAAYYGAWMTVLQDFLGRLTRDRQQSLVTRLLAASGGVASAR